MKYRFRFRVNGAEPTIVDVENGFVKIGKLSSSHLRIDNDATVNRMHAFIEVMPDGMLRIVDLGSTSGTRVNDQRVDSSPLKPLDIIRIGATTIEVVDFRPLHKDGAP